MLLATCRTGAIDEWTRSGCGHGALGSPMANATRSATGNGFPVSASRTGSKALRKQRPLTDEEQMPGGGIHRGRIRIEQAPRPRSVELTDIDATGFGTAHT